jgi:predicted DNA-binding protein
MNEDKQIHIVVTPGQIVRLQILGERENKTMQQLLKEAIELILRRNRI